MIYLHGRLIPARAARNLQHYQEDLDSIAEYAERVAQAKIKFKQINTNENSTFRAVRESLAKMCSGFQRCGYCEDSAAAEIDHHKPKTLYPDLTFVWENYVYSCGACNRPKLDKYSVFSQATGQVVSVARAPQAPIVPPEDGTPVLIDPRHENPLEFMRLDLIGTFIFLPIGSPASQAYLRARFTIDTLQLNSRPYLPLSRRQAYQGYLSHLHRYIHWRDDKKFKLRIHEPREAIQTESHPTVWQEMKRQHLQIPDLRELFEQLPEALSW